MVRRLQWSHVRAPLALIVCAAIFVMPTTSRANDLGFNPEHASFSDGTFIQLLAFMGDYLGAGPMTYQRVFTPWDT